MNIKEVATRAKVSTATVSRTINDPGKVRPHTAERVRKAIADLNFYPNTNARTLVSGRSRMVGLIVSDITNPFFPELVKSFENHAAESGLEVILGNTNYDPERMAGCVRRMVERKVDGVAIMTSEADPDLIDDLNRKNIPTVVLDTGGPGSFTANIIINYGQGIRQAVQHLVELNHRQIAFLAGPLHLASARTRQSAFLSALQQAGIAPPPEMIVQGDHKIEGGTQAMKTLLAQPTRPTAVIASNDMMAIGALSAIHDAGLRVPDDISVVGFDDIAFARLTQPPLTTVALPREQLAVIALSAIERLVAEGPGGQSEYSLPTQLVIRNSTRAIECVT